MVDCIFAQLERVRASLREADTKETPRPEPDYWRIALEEREAELISKLER
jgi:hypothetical protein